jgi:hypothetical protein
MADSEFRFYTYCLMASCVILVIFLIFTRGPSLEAQQKAREQAQQVALAAEKERAKEARANRCREAKHRVVIYSHAIEEKDRDIKLYCD